jgi:hypothetical protein
MGERVPERETSLRWASLARPEPRSLPPIDSAASAVATLATLALAVAILVGSKRLRDFDPALVGYAIGTLVLAFGLTYRLVVWVKNPPTRRALIRGGRAIWSCLSLRDFGRSAASVPPRAPSTLLFQSFIRGGGTARWLAHQSLFWGVVVAAAMTFPLTFGWIRFGPAEGAGSGYVIYFLGAEAAAFDAWSVLGWLVFHTLDFAAVAVIAGAAYFLWRRLTDRGVRSTQHFGRDLLPLLSLLAISVTGLLLTASSAFWGGRGYHLLALVHMATVVPTLVFIPFGKFFHPFQRPAGVGVELSRKADLRAGEAVACRRCGEPVESAAFVEDLRATVSDLGLGYPARVETCPRCKRVERGIAYRMHVKEGFR